MKSHDSFLAYLKWPIIVTAIGLVLSGWLGWKSDQTIATALSFLLIGAVLAALEIALSFDNAIVNANKLVEMTPIWRQRFLTWGILIAVFGMRIVFPILIVSCFAWINPFAAVHLAVTDPDKYSHIIHDSHGSIAAFGGTFLLMVALKFFIDEEKTIDWFGGLERVFKKCSALRGIEIAVVLILITMLAQWVDDTMQSSFLFSAILGLITFLLVDSLGTFLDQASQPANRQMATGGLGAFLYLEVLDASFSFDGVIGAFALTTNIMLIAIGLGIGAMYVRALTIMIVETGTLQQYRYIEHGAFYSIFVLAVIMFLQTITSVPELITGLMSATIIGFALYSSIRHNKREQSP